MCNKVNMVHIFSHRAYCVVYKRHILEYNYHICSDDPNTLIAYFIIHIYTISEFVLIFPSKHFQGA